LRKKLSGSSRNIFKKPKAKRENEMPGIGEEFIEYTKYRFLEPSDQMQGRKPPAIELEYDRTKKTLGLPDPENAQLEPFSLHDAIAGRTSVRSYSAIPLSIQELSYLLWCTQGVKRVFGGSVTLRTVPSAGARHAIETYLLVNNVQGLTRGIYRFLAIEHRLLTLNTDSGLADRVTEACFHQDFVKTAAVTFIWTAVVYRMKWRYGERGYRYLFLDAGHVCQNLYLGAESMGCGVCAVAAFSDDEMNALLGLDGVNQFVVYMAAVGKKEKGS
jgi:SagB-type dehydrogenase family enzyme